jgi:hypothetical protein
MGYFFLGSSAFLDFGVYFGVHCPVANWEDLRERKGVFTESVFKESIDYKRLYND